MCVVDIFVSVSSLLLRMLHCMQRQALSRLHWKLPEKTSGRAGTTGVRYAHRPNDKNFPMEWMYSAKHKSHWRPIVGLCFAVPEPGKQQRLFSVGEDRRLVEYTVKSSEFGGLQVHTSVGYV